jgi:hypothetical protein
MNWGLLVALLPLTILSGTFPTDGLVFHLDATKADSVVCAANRVTSWKDADGKAVAFEQKGANEQPTLIAKAFGTHAGVSFGVGAPSHLVANGATKVQTLFIVTQHSEKQALIAGIWGVYGQDLGLRLSEAGTVWRNPGNANDFTKGGLLALNGQVVAGDAEVVPNQPYLLTAVGASATSAATAFGNYAHNRYYTGVIAEVLAYDRALPESVRKEIEASLMTKWSIRAQKSVPASRLALKKKIGMIRAESVSLALKDMESQWPGAISLKAEALQPQIEKLQERLANTEDSTVEADAEKFVAELRSALLSVPLLKEAKLLLVKRSVKDLALPTNWDNVRGGNVSSEVIEMDNLAGTPTTRTVIKPRKPNDYIGELALHWDAKRLMFSSQNEKGKMRVYEVNLDTPEQFTEMQQVPDDDVDNLAGCWLADDATLFLSTATMIGVPCVRGGSHIYHLYRQDKAGIRRLTYDQEHNWYPTMLADGRVMYLRWEYSDIPHFVARILFTMNPDGTAQREYYGSNSYWPNSMFYAKPIPDGAGKFAAIVSGHHGVARMGELVVFDPSKGRFETDGVVQRIPGRGQKVEAKILDNLVDQSWPKFLHPLPLGGNYFIAPMKPDAKTPWGLYLVDMFDNMTLIAQDAQFALFEPVLLKPAKRPPVLPSQIAKDKPGYIKLIDIYSGPGLTGVPRGTIKSLRIGTYAYSYRGMGGQVDRVGEDGPWDVRRIIGTVPVSDDGSAFFEVPPNIPLMIQPLDEKGRAVQLMRSWVMSMPGEVQTCVGCHEPMNSSTPAHRVAALNKPIEKISPWYGPSRGFSFNREVQPVLDKYCVKCHDGKEQEIPNFTMRPDQTYMASSGGYRAAHFPPAYLALKKYVRNHTMESDMHLLKPYEFHASTTDLVRMLEAGHKSVKLDTESWDRINTWIDLNTPAHGTWTEISGEARTKQVAERRRELLKRYASIDEDPEDYEFRANPPKPKLDGKPVENTRPNMIMTLTRAPQTAKLIIATNEVTNQEFAEFDPQHDSGIEVGGFLQFSVLERGFPANEPSQPVVRVPQAKAKAYCEWLSKKTGKKYRLPTVAERMAFAKVAGRGQGNFADLTFHLEKALAPWGLPSGAVMNWRPADTNSNDKVRATAPVSTYPASTTGLYDVFGNVWEWTSELDSGGRAIAMGGSFASLAKQLTERSCVSYWTWQPVFDVGFRVVCEE